MPGTVNKVILVGRLGRDPELKYTNTGAPICSFSLATDESFTDRDGQKQERTEWHNIKIFSKLAEIAHQYLKKGSLVYLEGKIRTNEFTDRDNNQRRVTEVIVSEMTMLGGRPRGEEAEPSGEEYGTVYGSRPAAGTERSGAKTLGGPAAGKPKSTTPGAVTPESPPPGAVTTAPEIEDDLPF